METLLSIAFALMAGLLASRCIKKWHLPAVTAYLVAGVLIGPNCLGLLHIPGIGFSSFEEVSGLSLICDVALGFIAFSIGDEFRLSALRKTGKQAAVVAILQALAACLCVNLALLALHLVLGDRLPVSTCLVLGAVATATAPAATVMVINQYKAKGPVTNMLLPVVALDDAVGLIVFAISFGAAKTMISGSFSVMSILFNPILEILGSLLLGLVLGFVFSQFIRLFHSNSKRLSVAVAFVVLAAALSKVVIPLGGGVQLGFSPLLVCMMLGTVFCNACDFSEDIMFKTDRWTAPAVCSVFRPQRRGAGSAGLWLSGCGGHWRGLCGLPLPGQDCGRDGLLPPDEMRREYLQISGYHAAAPGGRGAGHVGYRGRRDGRAGQYHPGYYPVFRADL